MDQLVRITGRSRDSVRSSLKRNNIDTVGWGLYPFRSLEILENGRKIPPGNTSGFVGVYYYKSRRKWGAVLTKNGVRRFLGIFETKEEAVAAREKEEIKLGGKKEPACERGTKRKPGRPPWLGKYGRTGERYGRLTVVKNLKKSAGSTGFTCACATAGTLFTKEWTA